LETEKFLPEQHRKMRSVFRIFGPIFLVIAGVCMVLAFVDFFTLEGFEEPKYFWLFFIALPIIFVGFILTGLGYGSSVAKYQTREYAPVAKDTFNYLAKETTTGVKEIANALQQGSRADVSSNCHSCQQQNPIDARFCNSCGEKLIQICSGCQHENKNDAQFCNQCGSSLN
jgi:ribosomal protein L40E